MEKSTIIIIIRMEKRKKEVKEKNWKTNRKIKKRKILAFQSIADRLSLNLEFKKATCEVH